MNKPSIIILALAVLSLSGCKSLYGNYERPEVKTSGIVRDTATNHALAETDTASFGNLPWRSVFTDPKLQKLIERGLKNNYDLLNAALNVDMAEAQLKASKLAFLPSFTFSPQGTISSWDGGKATKTYSLPINASWNVDLFGNLRSQKRAAQMALLQSKDYQVSVQTSLISNIANCYYSLLMMDKEVEILDDMTKLTKETWDIMKTQMELGRVRSTGVQSAENNYYSTLTQKTELLRQIRDTENTLSLLLGEPGGSIARGKPEDQSLPSASTMCRRPARASIPISPFPATASLPTPEAWESSIPASGCSRLWARSCSPSSRTASSWPDCVWPKINISRHTTHGRTLS